ERKPVTTQRPRYSSWNSGPRRVVSSASASASATTTSSPANFGHRRLRLCARRGAQSHGGRRLASDGPHRDFWPSHQGRALVVTLAQGDHRVTFAIELHPRMHKHVDARDAG